MKCKSYNINFLGSFREPKDIEIIDIELVKYSKGEVVFTTTCSKGTYIRVLGSDIANAIGTVGHLTNLVRNSVGEYIVDESLQIDEFEKKWKSFTV